MHRTLLKLTVTLWKPLLLLSGFITAAVFNRTILDTLGRDTVAIYQAVMPYAIGIGLWGSAAWFVDHIIGLLVWEPLGRRTSVPKLVRDIVSILLYSTAITGIVGSVFGQSVGAFLTAGGAVGIVVGLALRNLIVDLFIGIAVNFERPFEIGQFIKMANGPSGKVTEINWRTTRIVDSSGDMIIVPNSRIGDAVITNFSRPEPASALEVVVCLDAAVPPSRALRVLNAAALGQCGTARCLEKPAPYVQVRAINNQGVEYGVVYYIDSNKAGPAWSRHLMLVSILEQLHQAGIGIAVPKQDVFHTPMPQRIFDTRTAEDRVTLLSRVQLFEGLTVEERQHLASVMHERLFKAGTDLIKIGDPGESMFVLFEGLLDVFSPGPDGNPLRVARLKVGTFFGEMSLLTGDARSATVTAACDCVVFEISRSHMATLIERRPLIAQILTEAIAQRRATAAAARANVTTSPFDDQRSFVQNTVARILKFFGVSGAKT